MRAVKAKPKRAYKRKPGVKPRKVTFRAPGQDRPSRRSKGSSVVVGAIFEDTKLKRFVRVFSLAGRANATIQARRSTTGRFTEMLENIRVAALRAPRYKLWRAAPAEA